MLLCPNCNHQLTTKRVRTSSSGTIDIDTCEACGGVYFDRGEVNRIPREEAEKLVAEHNVSAADTSKGTQHCPKCGSSLKRYWGESVPTDVYILRCPACHGAWFPKKDLVRFKEAQNAKIQFHKMWNIPLPSLSSVMLPISLFVLLTGSLWVTLHEIQKNQELRSYALEMLATPSEIQDKELRRTTIIFTTRKPARTELVFYYKKPTGKIVLPVSKQPVTTHIVTVPNLVSGTEYFYYISVVTGEESFDSPEYSFVAE